MTMNEATPLPDNLADMLPVGMLANGGIAAEAMAAVANRQHDTPGWEAFHYERVSETQFDITGGVAVMAGGMKKWPGPHETVSVTEAEILEEMRRHQTSNVLPILSEKPAPHIPHLTGASKTPFLNVVFALPEDEAGRQRILKAFHLQADFFGARVQACSLLDQI